MAGEVFVARQDTLESVKGTVEDIDTNLGTPDYAGGGTDVVAMVKALASAVTEIQTAVNNLPTLSQIQSVVPSSGEKTFYFLNNKGFSFSETVNKNKLFAIRCIHNSTGATTSTVTVSDGKTSQKSGGSTEGASMNDLIYFMVKSGDTLTVKHTYTNSSKTTMTGVYIMEL